MNPAYLRPLPEKKALRIIFWQELACFLALFMVFFVALVFLNRWPTLLLLQVYCTSLFVVIINAVSLYRRTVEPSLTASLLGLARRTAEVGRAANFSGKLARESVS